MTALTPQQMVSLGAGVPPKFLTAAKRELAVGTTREDFVVRVVSSVSKNPDEHGVVGECPASCHLWGQSAITAALTSLGIGRKRLGSALRSLCDLALEQGREQLGDDAFVRNDELMDEIAAIEHEYAAKLPPVQYSTSGKSGSVTVATTFTLLDQPEPPEAATAAAKRKPKPVLAGRAVVPVPAIKKKPPPKRKAA